ncbi:FeoB-associated Cys-rich membrane protein [Caldibacillus debilis]|uniref:FeoB-associated Cys-rich membrane protein n=1 Tax=Caldibacillus debilis TaxID=301148 RepID=UPI002FD88E6C
MFSAIIGALIFGYAGFALVRFFRKSKEGQCAACSLNRYCAKTNGCRGDMDTTNGSAKAFR